MGSRTTPKAVSFVHEHDSPRSILRELKEVLQATRTGVPLWMAEAKQELAALSASFEVRANAMLARLDDLARRCEAALRRAEATGSTIAEPAARLVPWAMDALEYLDQPPRPRSDERRLPATGVVHRAPCAETQMD